MIPTPRTAHTRLHGGFRLVHPCRTYSLLSHARTFSWCVTTVVECSGSHTHTHACCWCWPVLGQLPRKVPVALADPTLGHVSVGTVCDPPPWRPLLDSPTSPAKSVPSVPMGAPLAPVPCASPRAGGPHVCTHVVHLRVHDGSNALSVSPRGGRDPVFEDAQVQTSTALLLRGAWQPPHAHAHAHAPTHAYLGSL